MDGKELGKITRADLGHDDDGRFGLSLEFSMQGVGVQTFVGTWATRPEQAHWTLDDQRNSFADVMYLLRDTLAKAKRSHASQLVGVPIEVTFKNGMLQSWRVLEEVL